METRDVSPSRRLARLDAPNLRNAGGIDIGEGRSAPISSTTSPHDERTASGHKCTRLLAHLRRCNNIGAASTAGRVAAGANGVASRRDGNHIAAMPSKVLEKRGKADIVAHGPAPLHRDGA